MIWHKNTTTIYIVRYNACQQYGKNGQVILIGYLHIVFLRVKTFECRVGVDWM